MTKRTAWVLLAVAGVVAFVAGFVLLLAGWSWGLLIALVGATCATSGWIGTRNPGRERPREVLNLGVAGAAVFLLGSVLSFLAQLTFERHSASQVVLLLVGIAFTALGVVLVGVWGFRFVKSGRR